MVYLDDIISFGTTVLKAVSRLQEVLDRLSNFGIQLRANKCIFMQIEVGFLGHIVGRTGLACDQGKVSAVCTWHAPDSVKQVRQFVGIIGYYWLLSVHSGLCRTVGAVGGFNSEGGHICLDRYAAGRI